MELDKNQVRKVVAKRVTLELRDGSIVSPSTGLPMMIPSHLKPGVRVILQSGDGMVGMGNAPAASQEDPLWINVDGDAITTVPEIATFDSVTSFGIIRGSHVDVGILDALQVDEADDLVNWIIPGRFAPGTGGVMGLLVSIRKMILAMTHTAKDKTKILRECILPPAVAGQVDLIITELCVIKTRKSQGLYVTKIHNGVTHEKIEAATEATLHYVDDVEPMRR